MKRLLQITLLVMAVAGFTFLMATPSEALHKNPNNTLVCGGCHTMHNSQANLSLGGSNGTASNGGALILLRGNVTSRSQIHNLCLQCHGSNGQQSVALFPDEFAGGDEHPAPKVYIDGQGGAGNGFDGATFGSIGAGGDFSSELTGDSDGWAADDTDGTDVGVGQGHSLGLVNPRPPGFDNDEDSSGATSLDYFTCTSCHDPHGAFNGPTALANQFRNLRTVPTGSLEPGDIILNTAVRSYVGYGSCQGNGDDFETGITNGSDATAIWPVYKLGEATHVTGNGSSACDSAGGNVNSYGVSTGAATDGIANWCAACHDYWHEGNEATNGPVAAGPGADWRRHPVDRLLYDGSRLSGGGVTIIDAANYYDTNLVLGGGRLPIASTIALGSDPIYYMEVSGTDELTSKVFCLSCHFAHGGPNYDLLRWDYLSDVDTATTQIQTGNAIASNVGCQLCHNR